MKAFNIVDHLEWCPVAASLGPHSTLQQLDPVPLGSLDVPGPPPSLTRRLGLDLFLPSSLCDHAGEGTSHLVTLISHVPLPEFQEARIGLDGPQGT